MHTDQPVSLQVSPEGTAGAGDGRGQTQDRREPEEDLPRRENFEDLFPGCQSRMFLADFWGSYHSSQGQQRKERGLNLELGKIPPGFVPPSQGLEYVCLGKEYVTR